MGNAALVGLYSGLSGDDLYRSAGAAVAAGSVSGFSALALVKGFNPAMTAASDIMGNSNKSNTGWALSRGANRAASSPNGAAVNLQASVYYAGGVITANAYVPATDWSARHTLIGLTFGGSNTNGPAGGVQLYINGALVAVQNFAQVFVPGGERFTYGGIVAGNPLEDRLVGGLYRSAPMTAAQHAGAFELIRSAGGAVMTSLAKVLVSEYAWDSWFTRRPYKALAPVIPNKGTLGIAGDLTFPVANTDKLITNTDPNPIWTGGALIA